MSPEAYQNAQAAPGRALRRWVRVLYPDEGLAVELDFPALEVREYVLVQPFIYEPYHHSVLVEDGDLGLAMLDRCLSGCAATGVWGHFLSDRSILFFRQYNAARRSHSFFVRSASIAV